ncbi:hypothetical protein [Sulfurihydrogenibium sp.]|jgi:hypothetical protein|uniref:hypothetical protein n=1 Tax=Sulfurihydrogenibium sp. TaxID=2053621 RepID=UPI00262E457E|nr:hypothetical protein [Sulfurihydrogenibium sp.]
MVGKIFWESLSIALLLYGSYLAYVFIWFSLFRILDMDITTAKLISGSMTLTIIAISSIRWFIKKHKELKLMKNEG